MAHEVCFTHTNSFLSLFCNCQLRRLDSIEFACSHAHILSDWCLEIRLTLLSLSLVLRPTVNRPVCLGIKHPSEAYEADFYYCQTVASMLMRGALSDVRTGLSFRIAAGPRQRSHFRVRLPWDSWPYFTVSDSKRPFSSPPTTRGATVEIFEPASTRELSLTFLN
jgi:hypothetical protein